MYSRIVRPPERDSFFLFGPRGTGKSSWVRSHFPDATYIDLLDSETYRRLLTRPNALSDYWVPESPQRRPRVVIIDEVQKVPAVLDEVHRLIESTRVQFVLTGSNARKLRKQGTKLLAGRALTYSLYPLTAHELGRDFSLTRALQWGMLPKAVTSSTPKRFLESYVATYLKEIEQEGITRQVANFARFLETATFSQGAMLSPTQVASDAHVHRKVVEDYFAILRDLMLSYELPVFSKRAKRELLTKRKFYFFDAGVYRVLRPKGPLDSPGELAGAAFETLCVQELVALNHYLETDFSLFHWRTRKHEEVDLVLYGDRGLLAFEFKSSPRVRAEDVRALELFGEDYPSARRYLVHGGTESRMSRGIQLLPAKRFFEQASAILTQNG